MRGFANGAKFRELLAYARPGDTVHISEMFRLVRGTGHILDLLDILHGDQVALHMHDGAFSVMDLTACSAAGRHPRTGDDSDDPRNRITGLAGLRYRRDHGGIHLHRPDMLTMITLTGFPAHWWDRITDRMHRVALFTTSGERDGGFGIR
ncbi:recombinase family protein [Streptomyces uncialis]|uniref:recombinase family protein n=1 Tax=Streptomyces uncialis TaxID=1048205 RepID=UPI00381614FF